MESGEIADDAVAAGSEVKVVTTVGDLSVETTAADVAAAEIEAPVSAADDVYPIETPPNDGDDVARDPDAIAREIEQTRAELADTIDAIADRISPKRVASRGAQAVKAKVGAATPTPSGAGSQPSGDNVGLNQPAGSSLPIVPLATVAGVVLLILMLLRRRRSR
jgi:hypothetical protein